jgi:TRAP-type mannitol/chloroaromatic compound transport system permease small subunit
LSNHLPGIPSTLDRVSDYIGRSTAWLTLLMVLVTFAIVVLRYAFDLSFVWVQESLTWMHAAVFMLGTAYTLQQEQHVRVDIFYRKMSLRHRALVDVLGVLVFVFPLCGFCIYQSYDYVAASFGVHEISRDTGGLPYPAVPLLKSMLLLLPVTVVLQGLSLLLRSWAVLRGR